MSFEPVVCSACGKKRFTCDRSNLVCEKCWIDAHYEGKSIDELRIKRLFDEAEEEPKT